MWEAGTRRTEPQQIVYQTLIDPKRVRQEGETAPFKIPLPEPSIAYPDGGLHIPGVTASSFEYRALVDASIVPPASTAGTSDIPQSMSAMSH